MFDHISRYDWIRLSYTRKMQTNQESVFPVLRVWRLSLAMLPSWFPLMLRACSFCCCMKCVKVMLTCLRYQSDCVLWFLCLSGWMLWSASAPWWGTTPCRRPRSSGCLSNVANNCGWRRWKWYVCCCVVVQRSGFSFPTVWPCERKSTRPDNENLKSFTIFFLHPTLIAQLKLWDKQQTTVFEAVDACHLIFGALVQMMFSLHVPLKQPVFLTCLCF